MKKLWIGDQPFEEISAERDMLKKDLEQEREESRKLRDLLEKICLIAAQAVPQYVISQDVES